MRYAAIAITMILLLSASFALGPMQKLNISQNETKIEKKVENKHINIETIMNMIREKENRKYVFYLLKNSTINNQTKIMIKKQIILTAKESEQFRKQLISNKTLLIEFIPKYKPLIEKAKVENITVEVKGNQTMMKIKIKEHKKLFGILPVEIPEEIITNETTAKLKRPWWSIFVI